MRTYRLGANGILLACVGFFSMPATAQVQSDVAASNLRFVLVDLTPDDGETPWFNFIAPVPGPLSASSSVIPTVGSEQRARDDAEGNAYFEFSPNTRLSLALDIDIAMRAGPSAQPEQGGTVWAVFRGGATWGPPKDSWERPDYDDVYGDVGLYNGSFRTSFDRNQTLWLSFENDSAYAAYGDYQILLESSSYALAAPVPEAPAPAMLLLGAGVLGWVGRRRARTGRVASRS